MNCNLSLLVAAAALIGLTTASVTTSAQTKLWNTGGGAIIDVTTGLMWQAEPPNPAGNGFVRGDYCKNLTLAGSSDWRIPTLKEWYSLIDFGRKTASGSNTFYYDIKNYPNLNRHGEYLSSTYFPDARFPNFQFVVQFRPRYATAERPVAFDVENLSDPSARLICVATVPNE